MSVETKGDLGVFIKKLSKETGETLRPHQIEGVEFMQECWRNGYGCILADEMGLGKTCQAIVTLSYIAHEISSKISFLIVCPLSVLDHWRNEPKRFGRGLNVVVYRGDKEEREELREQLRKDSSWNIILTSYELLMNDSNFFARFKWTAVVIDEAHRLKNMDSIMHGIIADEIKYKWILLLTGTPVQNNLKELYSLLSLCHSDEFPPETLERFVNRFSNTTNEKAVNKLRQVLKRYILRRTKDIVSVDVPSKSEVILFHDLTDLQKDVYKAILMKNYVIFEGDHNKQRLMNTLIQLRKCVGHPYLFEGVEPEPFEQGEHLITASGKLMILDVLLSFLKKRGHKVLLFSQMTRMLDIVQDYLTYRGYSYERLDGSIRGEERFAAVQRFVTTETFCFLLSTRAGGLGLNLMAADTVIFLDSDFNPQNDLQAAARAHRMGQSKHVKVIRLVGRRTVEEIILARAAIKLKFTNAILQEQPEDFAKVLTAKEISEMLVFGLSEMNKKRTAAKVKDADLERLLGKSSNSHWMPPEDAEGEDWMDELKMKDIYTFEGKDYREEARQADREAFDDMKRLARETVDVPVGSEVRRSTVAGSSAELGQKRMVSEKELEELREKRREAAERRKLVAQENRLKKEEERKERLMQLWKENDYQSTNLPELTESEMEDENQVIAAGADANMDSNGEITSQPVDHDPFFVIGDVTKPDLRPEHKKMDVIIVHCVDDSGSWGRGGVFTALSSLSLDIESHYELAKKMKDLNLGDVHLVEVKRGNADGSRTFVALIVAQHYKKRNEIKMDLLEDGFKRLSYYASKNHCTVHMARIGYGMASFNWYGTERMIRKLLCQRGVPTYVYYYQRKQQQRKRRGSSDKPTAATDNKESDSDQQSETGSTKSDDIDEQSATKPKRPKFGEDTRKRREDADGDGQESDGGLPYLPPLFEGCLFNINGEFAKEDARRLRRLIIAYGGQVATDTEAEKSTHVLVEDMHKKNKELEKLGKPVVTRSWLEKCVKAEKLLPVE